jgi:hypothetical protein
VSILENVIPGNEPTLATTLTNLAQMKIMERSYAAAEQLNLAAISAWEKSVGSDHPSLVSCLISQVLILRKMKRKSEAAAFQKRVAAIRAKYGSDFSSHSIDIGLLQAAGKKRKPAAEGQ